MSEWIKCSERLPDDNAIVIGTGFLYGKQENGRWVESTILAGGVFYGLIINEDYEYVADFDVVMKPTHWQALPEPPKD